MTEEGRKRMLPREKPPSIWRRLGWKVERIWQEFRRIPRNIKMIIEWIPVLWNNYDFDHAYLFIVLKYKLKRMREHIVEHNIVMKAPEIGAQIQFCEDLITRLQDDDYVDEERAAHEEKWGRHVWDSIPVEGDREYFMLDMYSPMAREQGLEEQEQKEYRVLGVLASKRRQKDLDVLFRVMRKCIEGWWD